MAGGAGAIRAGRAFVELFADDSQLVRGLRRAQQRLQRFGAITTRIGTAMLGLGAAAATPFAFAIKAASDLEETMNKFNVVFGSNAAAVKQWGDDYAGQVGRSKRQIADFMAGTQDLLVPLGFEPGAATEMSKQLTSLAVDLASFNNMTDEEAMQSLQAGLLGESDALKKFGVVANETAVKAELLNQGLDPKNATEQQKVMARLAIIMQGTTAAQGDAVRSSGSFANQMKRLKGTLEDTAATIGTALLPVVTPLITMAGDAIKVVAQWAEQNTGLVRTAALVVAGIVAAGAVLVGLGTAVTVVGFALGGLATLFSLIGTVLGALLSPLGILVAVLAGVGIWLVKSGIAAEWFASTFGPLMQEAVRAFDAIKIALKGGDFGAAAQVLWTTLKFWWAKGTDWLTELWVDFKRAFLEIFLGLASEGAKLLTNLWSTFQQGLLEGMKMLDVAQGKTANKLLEWAGEDGPLGDVARLIVGADLRGEGMVEGATAESNRMTAADQQARAEEQLRIERDRQAAMAEIDAQFERDVVAMNAGMDAQLQGSAADVDRARAEMDAAIAAAEQTRTTSPAESGGAAPNLDALLSQLQQGSAAATTASTNRQSVDFGLDAKQIQFLRLQGGGRDPSEQHLKRIRHETDKQTQLLEQTREILATKLLLPVVVTF